MNRKELEGLRGKRVYLRLKSTYGYTGHIEAVDETSFTFIDKYGSKLILDYDEVAVIEELQGGGKE